MAQIYMVIRIFYGDVIDAYVKITIVDYHGLLRFISMPFRLVCSQLIQNDVWFLTISAQQDYIICESKMIEVDVVDVQALFSQSNSLKTFSTAKAKGEMVSPCPKPLPSSISSVLISLNSEKFAFRYRGYLM